MGAGRWPSDRAEASPVAERAGTVTPECSSAVWMAEIDLLGPETVAQVNAIETPSKLARYVLLED